MNPTPATIEHEGSASTPIPPACTALTHQRRDGHRRLGHVAAIAVLLLPSACENSQGPTPTITQVMVSSPVEEVEVGGTAQLTGTALDPSGAVVPAPGLTWSTSSASVATVTRGGLVTGRGAGNATITAAAAGRSGSASITVRPVVCNGATVGTVGLGQVLQGTLGRSDCHFLHGAHARGWSLDIAAPVYVQVDLASTAFDALLVVTDARMNIIAYDDDSGGNLNAQLRQWLTPGRYVVWATTLGPGQTGAFQLSLQSSNPVRCDRLSEIAIGQTVRGALSSASCSEAGRFVDRWLLELPESTTLQIDMRSGQFDTYLFATDDRHTLLAQDDDGGGDLNSRITHRFAPGRVILLATSYAPASGGSYELSVQRISGRQVARAPSGPGADASSAPVAAILRRLGSPDAGITDRDAFPRAKVSKP